LLFIDNLCPFTRFPGLFPNIGLKSSLNTVHLRFPCLEKKRATRQAYYGPFSPNSNYYLVLLNGGKWTTNTAFPRTPPFLATASIAFPDNGPPGAHSRPLPCGL
jgi:hypothetical protein